MELPDYIAALRREGDRLAAVAARTDLDAPVPTCPDWQVRDLVRHVGSVHRWATAQVADRLTKLLPALEDVGGPWPDDALLLNWFREGHAALVQALETADPDLDCWTFLAAPSPLAFWARRQAHETGIHRVDAESVIGTVTPFAQEFAVDGIDELLFCFASRPGGRLRSEVPRTLHIHATDVDGEWLLHIGPEGVQVSTGHVEADCAVRGPASDLHLLLWNRRTSDGLEVHGDRMLLERWRHSVRVRWS